MVDIPELIVLDVGHGNCAILRDTEAVTVIDCPPGTILLDTLEQLEISTVDHVLISHADIDHIGGLPTLLENVTVRNVYINPDAEKKKRSSTGMDVHWLWGDIRVALNWHSKLGTRVHLALNTSFCVYTVIGKMCCQTSYFRL